MGALVCPHRGEVAMRDMGVGERSPQRGMRAHRCAGMVGALLLGLIWHAPGFGVGEEGSAVVRASAASVGQYEKLEITVAAERRYENPFDPAEVEVVGVFRSPSGRVIRVPGYYAQGYERARDAEGNEVLTAKGEGVFEIRFASAEVGRHGFRVVLTDGDGTRTLGSGSFEVTASASTGYVRRSQAAPLYFEMDSGDPYFAIGENICWPGAGGTYDYDLWMTKLAEHGGNYTRLWLVNEWNALGLENRAAAEGDGNGLGRYNQEAAWRIDSVLDLAERLGVRVLMCIDSFNSLDAGGIYGMWDKSPYNAANGGPCEEPAEFFTDAEAKRLFKQRLRYVVGRWGHSTSVFAWEFWNEVDLTTGYDSAAVAAWHREMAEYVREIDPWGHLIATSYATPAGDAAVDGLAEMDFVQSHSYGARDIAEIVNWLSVRKTEEYGKPHYVGEFGADWRGVDDGGDKEGVHLHNGLWAAMLSGSAGTAMLWWWDSYVEPYDLYGEFSSVAAFAAEVDWVEERYEPREAAEVRFAAGQEPTEYPTLIVEPRGSSWEDGSRYNEPQRFRVGGNGAVENHRALSRIQHGLVNHPTWHNPATFEVDYPRAGRFEVVVEGVSGHGGAAIAISLDGVRATRTDFFDRQPDSTDTMHEYDGSYGIGVPAGQHTIVVENLGRDWFDLREFRLTHYLAEPNVRVLALANGRSALVWVQNKENTWWKRRGGALPTPMAACEIELRGFEPGAYAVEQWDTYAGDVIARSSYESSEGTVVVTTPAGLASDVAYTIRPVE